LVADNSNRSYRQLAAAIILQAVTDIAAGPGKNGEDENYRSALKFVKTGWFEFLAEAVAIDPDAVRAVLAHERKVRQTWKKYLARKVLPK
jgi:hypothetical protein